MNKYINQNIYITHPHTHPHTHTHPHKPTNARSGMFYGLRFMGHVTRSRELSSMVSFGVQGQEAVFHELRAMLPSASPGRRILREPCCSIRHLSTVDCAENLLTLPSDSISKPSSILSDELAACSNLFERLRNIGSGNAGKCMQMLSC